MKEEISGNVVEVRRKSDRIMAIVLTLGREVMRMICAYGPQSGRPDAEKVRLIDEIGSEWDFGSSSKSLFPWGMLMDIWGNVLRVLKMYTGELGKEMQKEGNCCSSVMKKSCAWQALGSIRQTKRKKSLTLPVDVKQKLILCLWEKNTESM